MSPTPLDPVSGSPSGRTSESLKQTQEDQPDRGDTRYKASRQEGRRGKTCDSTPLSLISCRSLRTCSNTVICKVTQQEALPRKVRSLGRRTLRAVGARGAATAPGDMWSPRAVHSRLVQREACASVLSAAATVAGPRLRLNNFYDRLDSLVMRTDSSCVEISDSRVVHFILFLILQMLIE